MSVHITFEQLKYLTPEDVKEMNNLIKMGVPDDVIETAIQNTVNRNREEGRT